VTAEPAASRRHPALARAAWWWGPVVVYAAVIFIGSSISQPPSLPEIVTDKSLHGSLYAGFALVLLRALARRWNRVTLFTMAAAVVLAALYGASDELGVGIAENEMHVHDFHATILHCLGFDHTRLTYRHAGRDFRLTDVHGEVVKSILV